MASHSLDGRKHSGADAAGLGGPLVMPVVMWFWASLNRIHKMDMKNMKLIESEGLTNICIVIWRLQGIALILIKHPCQNITFG